MKGIQLKKRVIVLAPVLSHYRRDIYNCLSESENFDFTFVGGSKYQNIKSVEPIKGRTFSYYKTTIFKHRFYYLKRSIYYILRCRPDVIISSGVDFHLIHTIILFFIFRILLRRKFIWWSQGTKGHQGKMGWILRTLMYKFASGVLLYSQSGYDNLIKMGVQPDKLKVVGNCLNKDDYGFLNYPLENKKKSGNAIKILFTGRITDKVDLETFIRAIHILKLQYGKKIICYVVGNGVEKEHLNLIKSLELNEQFLLLGAKYGKETHAYFLDTDLYVYPGGVGLSILHAFSFGLPVITIDDELLHFPEVELLKIGRNGDVYQNKNYKSLAEKILKWKDKIRNGREQIVNSTLEVIEEKGYMPKQVAKKIIEFLEVKI